MATLIVRDPIPLAELRRLAAGGFGDFVKAVVDVEAEVMAVGGELHADQETMLLEEGSQQHNIWGINIYPDLPAAERLEFDSMINVRPSQGNRSRSVESEVIRHRIETIVSSLVRE